MALPNIINAHELGPKICEVLDIDPNKVGRLILDIDATATEPIRVYVELLADERMLSVDWSALRGLQVNRGKP